MKCIKLNANRILICFTGITLSQNLLAYNFCCCSCWDSEIPSNPDSDQESVPQIRSPKHDDATEKAKAPAPTVELKSIPPSLNSGTNFKGIPGTLFFRNQCILINRDKVDRQEGSSVRKKLLNFLLNDENLVLVDGNTITEEQMCFIVTGDRDLNCLILKKKGDKWIPMLCDLNEAGNSNFNDAILDFDSFDEDQIKKLKDKLREVRKNQGKIK